jgi:F-type H+-transporting ATPase subunit a
MSKDPTIEHHHETHSTVNQPVHESTHHPEGGEVFTHLISEIGDTYELNLFFVRLPILPVIVVDDGIHIYPNLHVMEESGAFTLHHSKAPFKLVSTTKVDAAGNPLPPALNLSVTNYVAYEWIAMAIVTILFLIARRRYIHHATEAPKGIQNLLESIVIYIRDEIVVPNVGTVKRAVRLMPYIMSLFFFILTLNLLGLIPGWQAATGALGITMALALTSFVVVNYISFKDAGPRAWFSHLLGGAPAYIAPIMVPIEIVSLFTKPFALMIRLFANMTAGHIVILSLLGLIFFSKSWFVTPISVGFSVFIYLLELLVAFLQAYIFAMLTSVFVGLALGDHAHADNHHDTERLH